MATYHNECLACGHPLSNVLRSQSRMTWRGQLLFAAGVLIGLPWALLMIIVSLGTVLLIPLNSEGVVLWLKIMLGPGYLLAKLGFERPRVRKVRCFACGWRGSIDVPARSFGAKR